MAEGKFRKAAKKKGYLENNKEYIISPPKGMDSEDKREIKKAE